MRVAVDTVERLLAETGKLEIFSVCDLDVGDAVAMEIAGPTCRLAAAYHEATE